MVSIPLRHSDILVTQQLRDLIEVDSRLDKAGCKGVTEVVKAESNHFGSFYRGIESPQEIAPDDFGSRQGRENKRRVGSSHTSSVLGIRSKDFPIVSD
jgi:hypothetical protein